VRCDGAPAQEAWTLNVSRGGIRVIVEEPINVGTVCVVEVGSGSERKARVVWVREEADGQIVGLKFEDLDHPDPALPAVAARADEDDRTT
jgi:hypothetical protein